MYVHKVYNVYFQTCTNYVIIQVTATTLEELTKRDQRVRYFKGLYDICTRDNVPYLKGYTTEDAEGRHFDPKSQLCPPQISALWRKNLRGPALDTLRFFWVPHMEHLLFCSFPCLQLTFLISAVPSSGSKNHLPTNIHSLTQSSQAPRQSYWNIERTHLQYLCIVHLIEALRWFFDSDLQGIFFVPIKRSVTMQ